MSKLEPYRPQCFADKRQIAIGWRTFATQQELRDWLVRARSSLRLRGLATDGLRGHLELPYCTVNVFTSQKQPYIGRGSEGWLL